ncbi:MAG: hypothetical protein WBU92_00205 [Candidatus Dormiibacterota bacterium]
MALNVFLSPAFIVPLALEVVITVGFIWLLVWLFRRHHRRLQRRQ